MPLSVAIAEAGSLEHLWVQRSRYALAYATATTPRAIARHARTLDRLEEEIERCQEVRDTEDPSKSLPARPILDLDHGDEPAARSGRFARHARWSSRWSALTTAVVVATLCALAVTGVSAFLHLDDAHAAASDR